MKTRNWRVYKVQLRSSIFKHLFTLCVFSSAWYVGWYKYYTSGKMLKRNLYSSYLHALKHELYENNESITYNITCLGAFCGLSKELTRKT